VYLSQLKIKNFRQFGPEGIVVDFQPGIVTLAGPNDSGKSAIIDAIRYVVTTKDQEFISVQPEDFHTSKTGAVATEIEISCTFSGLSKADQSTFLEYLTPAENGNLVLHLHWGCVRKSTSGSRKWNDISLKSGLEGQGPSIDSVAKHLLACAYLRPLRDAEREMSSGRNSRLSQVLTKFPDIESGSALNPVAPPADVNDIEALSLAGLSEYIRHLVNKHSGVTSATKSINDDYLSNLSLVGDDLAAEINFVSGPDDSVRLKQVLERLELNLLDTPSKSAYGRYGLGSNNLLYMACELLLISKEREGLPLLLVEEPEAHLHPQRQLQLMSFLESKAAPKAGEPPIQVIVSTHSPVLASKVKVENLILINDNQAFSLSMDRTKLSKSDYRFLGRFLDATKSNLFFSQGVLIVEGDAEELLLPTISRLIERDLTKFGVSIVNVGSTGLRRYSRIFQRQQPEVLTDSAQERFINIPIASITDRDIMPNEAPVILGYVKNDVDEKWSSSKRKWRVESDPKFLSDPNTPDDNEYAKGRAAIEEKLSADDGQYVKTFAADHWTFEYDMALGGLAKQVFVAAKLALADDRIHNSDDADTTYGDVVSGAESEFDELESSHSGSMLAIHVYKEYVVAKASKAVAAQYLAQILEQEFGGRPADLLALLPSYLKNAINYATSVTDA
jgi:putative ATP-dependent endonuclease of OLD family